jgi:hypothetical protein
MIDEIKKILKQYELKELLNIDQHYSYFIESANARLFFVDGNKIEVYECGTSKCILEIGIEEFKKEFHD